MHRAFSAFLLALFIAQPIFAQDGGPYFATGIKIGEVTDSSAIVWVRLTRSPEPVGEDAPTPEILYRDPADGAIKVPVRGKPDWVPEVVWPGGSNVDTIEGAAPGAPGYVRAFYREEGTESWIGPKTSHAIKKRDYTCQITFTSFRPSTRYEIRIDAFADIEDNEPHSITGRFRTAHAELHAKPVRFTVSTGQRYPQRDSDDGFKIYDSMLRLDPDFFVHTGDIVYYDDLAKTEALARWHWQRTYSLPSNKRFHRQVASYFIKDDHDTWRNDCWPEMKSVYMGDFTFEQGKSIFLEQVPMGEKTYRTVRWGKDLQIWLVEGRDFRSANTDPDGPGKTIWGAEQKAWFKRTVQESDATFRILISPTPIVGPDRSGKSDNHSNRVFAHEGNELREFIASQKNMIVICGDRHWQYVSKDAATGVKEYSCGPASNEHAGGWSNDQRYPEHEYLNVVGGFLSIELMRPDGVPTLTARHHGVDGKVLNEDVIRAR